MRRTRFLAVLSAATLLFSSLMPSFTNSVQAATTKVQATQSPIEKMMKDYNVSLAFIEGELNKGYFITEIQKALDQKKTAGSSYETAMQKIHPLPSKTKPPSGPVISKGPDVAKQAPNDLSKIFGKPVAKPTPVQPTQTSNTTASITSMATTVDPNPVDLNQSIKQAPYAVPDASYSTLNGAVLGEYEDMAIAGKNGFGFTLKREYDSSIAQLYDIDYSTMTTRTKYDSAAFMLGLGWRWAIPSLENRNGMQVHMADGAVYSAGSTSPYTFSSYQWKDLSLKTDSSQGYSGYLLTSTKDHVNYYFNVRGQLMKMMDVYGNYISFKYASTAIDPVTFKPLSTTPTTAKVPLTEIDTSNGNSMKISYCYPNSTVTGCNSTSPDQQVIITSGDRSVIYKYTQYTYDTNMNMLLLSSVSQKVDDSTQYETDYSYWYYQAKSATASKYKINPYALLKRIVYPTGATSNFVYTKDTLTNYTTATSTTIASQNEVYELMETYKTLSDPGATDPQVYTGNKYNRATLNFNGQNMTSLASDSTFTVSETRDGVSTSYKYLKSSYNKVPYFVLSTSISNDGTSTTETDNTYSQLKDNGTTTVTTYPYPNQVTQIIKSNSDPTNSVTYYSNTNYTDYGEIRDQAVQTTTAPPLNPNIKNEYDTTKRWLNKTTECLNQGESVTSCSNAKITTYMRDTTTGAIKNMTIQDVKSGKNVRQENSVYETDSKGNITGNLLEKDVQDGAWNNLTVTQFAYDDKSFLKSSTTAVKSTEPSTGQVSTINVTKSYHFDPLMGTLLQITDGNGNSTSYKYDNLGRIIQATYPDSETVDITYEVNNTSNTLYAKYSHLDPSTAQTVTIKNEKHRWDSIGNKIGDFLFNGPDDTGIWMQQVGYFYENNYDGHVTSQSDENGAVTQYELDKTGRQTKVTYNSKDVAANQMVETYHYDDVNLIQQHTDADNQVQQTKYDQFGNQIEQDQIVSGQVSVLSTSKYDLARNVLSSTDANGNKTQYQYDAGSQLMSVSPADAVQTNYSYDARGLVLSTSVGGDNGKVQKSYDELGRLVQTTDETGNVDRYTYDNNGNVKTHLDHKGQLTTYTYDSRDRLLSKTVGGDTVSYTYDGLGRRTSMNDSTGTTTYAYTYLDQLDHIGLQDGKTTSFHYDTIGSKRIGMTDPFGLSVSYQKDAFDRTENVTVDNNTTPEAQYTYLGSNVKTLTEANSSTFTNTYDPMLRLSNLTQNSAGKTAATYDYSYDTNSNMTSKKDSTGDYSFTYDKQNRILTQVKGDNSDTYTYDQRGNRKTVTSSSPTLPPTNKYEYDASNQLQKVTTVDGETVTYRYNGDGLLYERTDDQGTARYYYDDKNEVIAIAIVVDGTASLDAHYIRGGNDELIARQAADGTKAYYSLNGHGDVTELRDSNGAVLNSYTYDIWGNPTVETETVENPFRYSGELWDSTTKLQYLRARWYDPAQGRFISQDTVTGDRTHPLTLNLYTYVLNNPLTAIDPSGNDAIVITNPSLAAGEGHTGAILQDANGDWYYFYWGDYNVQYQKVDDPDALTSLTNFNAWGQKKGLAGFDKGGFINSTYIQGDFSTSANMAKNYKDTYTNTHEKDGKNYNYNVLTNNCLQVTSSILSWGVLYNNVDASRIIYGDDGLTGSIIPNHAILTYQNLFYNDAFTFGQYYSDLESKLSYYKSMTGFSAWLNKSGYHVYRIKVLLDRNPS